MHLPDGQRPQILPWPEAARFPCNMHTCTRASGSKFSIQRGERHHVLTHLMVDRDLCRGATTVRPAWRHIHDPPRVQERQRLQLTMAPRRKRANPPRLLAMLMPGARHNPIVVRMAGRTSSVSLVKTKTAADGRRVITPLRLAAGRRRPDGRRGWSSRTGCRDARSLTCARGRPDGRRGWSS